jgi:phosphotransferase system HPr-like phosphotransfer protein
MQTTVNVAQAFGIPGEMYDLTPRRVDAFEVAADATMGGLAGFHNGKVGPFNGAVPGSTTGEKFSTLAGIFVRPHEMVNYGADGEALKASLTIKAGVTAQVCSMGRVIVKMTLATKEGDSVYVTAAGAYTDTASGNTLVGKIIKGGAANDLAVIELG